MIDGKVETSDIIKLRELKEKFPALFYARIHHLDSHGVKLSFHNRKWQIGILKDNNSQQVYMKASQVGMSTVSSCKTFALASKKLRGMYLLQDRDKMREVTGDIYDSLIRNCPEYRIAVGGQRKEKDNVAFKTIYGMGWMFSGAGSAKTFFSTPTDVIIIDEYELCELAGHLDLAQTRLFDSADPHLFKFGNPSIPGQGIHKIFEEETDCRYWNIPCPSCGHLNVLDWFTHFVEQDPNGQWALKDPDGQPVCEECLNPFDRLSDGTWIPLYPERTISGYQISRLFGSPDKGDNVILGMFDRWIKAQGNPKETEIFYRMELGLPYAQSIAKLNEMDLINAMSEEVHFFDSLEQAQGYNFDMPTFMGLDGGGDWMVVEALINNKRHLIYAEQFSDISRAMKAMEIFKVDFAVGDEAGWGHHLGGMPDLMKRYPNKVLGCHYNDGNAEDPRRLAYIKNGTNGIRLIANRQESMALTVAAIRAGNMLFPKSLKQVAKGLVWKHLLSSYLGVKGEGDKAYPFWLKGKDGDDYRHCDNYAFLACETWKKWRGNMNGNSVSSLTESVQLGQMLDL